MTMQSLLSAAADILPHWLWAAMCHQLFDHTGSFGYSMPLATNRAFVVEAPRNFRKAMAPSRLAGAATGAAS